MAIGLIATGVIGQWVALREQRGFDEVDLISEAYVALMVVLMAAMIWLALFMTFNLDQVKWIVKFWIYTHWREFWASLSSEEQTHLTDVGNCTSEGNAMSELNDNCWEALKLSIFHSWKLGGLLAGIMAVLLPFNVFFAGTKIGWGHAMDAVQSFIAYVSIAAGIGLLVLAFYVQGMAIVGCVLAGFVVVALATFQLAPHYFAENLPEDFEQHQGKVLFFIYTGLAAGCVSGAVYAIVNCDEAELTTAIAGSSLVSIHPPKTFASATLVGFSLPRRRAFIRCLGIGAR